jgi:DNA-damage-inducible protein J
MASARTKPKPKTKAKPATVRTRVDSALKAEAERVLGELGLTAGDAIRLFYTQVALRRGLPFEVTIPEPEVKAEAEAARPEPRKKRTGHTPNAVTRKVLRDADAGKGLIRFESVDAMFDAILGRSWRDKDPR